MPPRRTSPAGYAHSRRLRRESTPAELKLWACLRSGRLSGVLFRRQHAIGPYVADFCSPRHKLVIELDGSPHLHREELDRVRSEFLSAQGYHVLRFWNHDVLNNVDGFVAAILAALRLA